MVFERVIIIMMIVLVVEVLSVIGLNVDGIVFFEFKKVIILDFYSVLKNWNDLDVIFC